MENGYRLSRRMSSSWTCLSWGFMKKLSRRARRTRWWRSCVQTEFLQMVPLSTYGVTDPTWEKGDLSATTLTGLKTLTLKFYFSAPKRVASALRWFARLWGDGCAAGLSGWGACVFFWLVSTLWFDAATICAHTTRVLLLYRYTRELR